MNTEVQLTGRKNCLPFVVDLSAPDFAVPTRPTGYKFKSGKCQHFFYHSGSVTKFYPSLITHNLTFGKKRLHVHARQDRTGTVQSSEIINPFCWFTMLC